MKVYISGSAAITPQHTFDKTHYLKDWQYDKSAYYTAIEPDYRDLIDPKLSRRMSRIIKMSTAAAMQAMAEAGIQMPGAIIVGTGLGCIGDTEKFLKDIIETNEGVLSPTAFIQSTHNTIAGQIALLLNCPHYNFTYSNRGHSFENALKDALLQVEEGNDHILVGGAEETIPVVHMALHTMGCVGSHEDPHTPVLGEGASYFVLSGKTSQAQVAIEDILTLNNPTVVEVKRSLHEMLRKNQMALSTIDVVILGVNQEENDDYYTAIRQEFSEDTTMVRFKNISGEYFTASAYAMQLGVTLLEKQQVFQKSRISGSFEKKIKNVLIYNHYQVVSHSFILLSR